MHKIIRQLKITKAIPSVRLNAFIGMIAGFIQLKIKKANKKTPVPFGPSIAAAALIVYFYGDIILEWYTNLFI